MPYVGESFYRDRYYSVLRSSLTWAVRHHWRSHLWVKQMALQLSVPVVPKCLLTVVSASRLHRCISFGVFAGQFVLRHLHSCGAGRPHWPAREYGGCPHWVAVSGWLFRSTRQHCVPRATEEGTSRETVRITMCNVINGIRGRTMPALQNFWTMAPSRLGFSRSHASAA